MRKIFTFLFALAASVGASWAAPAIAENGKLPGAFSVSASKKVNFSQGNLQYVGTWQFAANQWEYFGNNQSNDHRDLFGWGTGGAPNKVSLDNKDYATFTDWGTNAISNGGTGWRTLTKDEWGYLLGPGNGGTTPSEYRTNYQSLRGLCKIKVSGTEYPGMIILPDDLYDNLPTEGEIATRWAACAVEADNLDYDNATFTMDEWTALQDAGAVFLPAAGYRGGNTVYGVGTHGNYWSSSFSSNEAAFYVNCFANSLYPENSSQRRAGRSVRLVQDIPTSGSCGENLTWSLNTETGELTISGTGAMNDYSWYPNAAPWYAYRNDITSVSFPEGITTIGAYAFVNCDNAAFTTVTIPEGVTALGVNAFYNCDGIQEITIPSTVTTIEVGAIYDCKAVNSITSYIASPTNLHGYAIYGYKNTCTLYVPYASIAAYQAADCWKYIPNIAAIPGTEPATPANVNIIPNEDPENPTVYYSTFYDSEVKYLLPENVEAYIVTTVSGDVMQLKKVADAGQTIPAGAGVILKSTVTPNSLTPSDADAVSVEGNRLEGSDVSIATPANCYVLSCKNDLVGFYHYTASMLNPHKAYIVYSGSNQAPRRLRFAFDQATGVENVQGDNVQSTKVIENGVLYIIKNGVKYNAMGQEVK